MLRGLSVKHRQPRMAASESVDTRPGVPAGRAPAARKDRRRLVMRRVGNGVMFGGLAVGVYALLPRLGGHVRTWAEHDAVVNATWMAGGVAQVRDDLDVTG